MQQPRTMARLNIASWCVFVVVVIAGSTMIVLGLFFGQGWEPCVIGAVGILIEMRLRVRSLRAWRRYRDTSR